MCLHVSNRIETSSVTYGEFIFASSVSCSVQCSSSQQSEPHQSQLNFCIKPPVIFSCIIKTLLFSNVLLQVSSVFSPGNFQGFALVNRQRTNRISTGFTVEISTEGTQLSYSNFDYLGQEPHYWQFPDVYQGDKVSIKECIQWLNQWK